MERNLGALLRRFRKEAGLTQEALAERALLSVRTVSDIESGAQRRPRADTLEALAEALGLDADARARLAISSPAGDGTRKIAPLDVPEPPSPVLGREREIDEIVALLAVPATRLLTLTGLGGVGKTSLAFVAARAFARRRSCRAVLAEMAAVDAPELVLPVIGQSLAQQSGTDFVETIASAVGDEPILLVVDNFEHVRAAAADLSRLLTAIPALRILATSRFALGLRVERVYAVGPLKLDDARRLFVERALRAFPEFDASDARAGTIVERLDRLPLAIELAAPRVKVLGIEGLLSELEQRLPLLSSRDADRPLRQRTLTSTIAWSYDLLEPNEQRAFRRVSVFRGGFEIGGARRIIGAHVVDTLESLLDKHLVRRCEREGEPPRFGMLETIAEFARDRARDEGEWEELSSIHAQFVGDLVGEAEEALSQSTTKREQTLRSLDDEIDNVRAALSWCSETNDVATSLRIAASLWKYWLARDMPEEARYQLRSMIGRYEMGAAVPPAVAAKAYCNAASFELAAGGDLSLVRAYAQRSAELYREIGDAEHANRILGVLESL